MRPPGPIHGRGGDYVGLCFVCTIGIPAKWGIWDIRWTTIGLRWVSKGENRCASHDSRALRVRRIWRAAPPGEHQLVQCEMKSAIEFRAHRALRACDVLRATCPFRGFLKARFSSLDLQRKCMLAWPDALGE